MNAYESEEERLRALADRLQGLPSEIEPARDLWPEIAARIEEPAPSARPRVNRRLLQVAAALAIFAGGVVVGRGTTKAPAQAPIQVPVRVPASVRLELDTLHPAIEVQRTGSEYVAALASLRESRDPQVRRQGSEAALSTLYGAARELTRISPEDPGALNILDTVSTARARSPEPGPVKF
jgi:hypothetical protein